VTETMKDIFLWSEKVFPRETAITDALGNSWSFEQLNNFSRSVCESYAELVDIKKGDRVGWLSLEASAPLLSLSFGVRKMGAVPVIMNSRSSAERIAWMINNVGMIVLAYSAECRDLLERVQAIGLPSVRQYIAIGECANIPNEVLLADIYSEFSNAKEPEVKISAEELCFISYTSGTTGQPKPVIHLEDEWTWTAQMMAHVLGLTHKDVTLLGMPPSFIGWAHVTCASLRVGAKQSAFRFEARRFLDTLAREKGTHALLSPTLVRMLYSEHQKQSGAWMTDCLRVCAFGGEPVTADVHTKFEEMFPNVARLTSLGATEGILLHSGVGNSYIIDHVGAIGKPLPGVTVELRDEDTGDVINESGKRGVLYARGPGISAGIWNDAEATAKNFPDGWWRTGDMLERDESGYFIFAGRNDHMFKSGNIKVYSEDVEAKLKMHPAVLDAVVVAVSDPTFGLVPFAFIRHSSVVAMEEMERWWLENSFERYIRPRHWKFWGESAFPMLTDVKIDRRTLGSMAEESVKEGVA
jgi:acyl-coenzyme A synthetase/AMP-(fatty) acid ligase